MPITRRDFLLTSAAAFAAPSFVRLERQRPLLVGGVQVGDVLHDRAIIWSRSEAPVRPLIEWSTSERFTNVRTVRGAVTRADSAFTSHVDVGGLPAGETIWYRVTHEGVGKGEESEPVVGSFRTPSRTADRDVRLVWTGDMVGQGWGIDESRGGIRMHETMRRAEPDVLIHSGDNIYADAPLLPEVPLDDGTVWRNLVTEAKSRVAQSLDDFRGNFAYNLLDANVRRFNASVPVIAQWDDHEVLNNWYWEEILADTRYAEQRVRTLAERARQALFEFLPMRRNAQERNRVYRRFSYGPLVEIFVIDMRSYRGANGYNHEGGRSPGSAILGAQQVAWLGSALRRSRATWKVIACDMPIGLVVGDGERDGKPAYEAVANGDARGALGRELEIAALLEGMQRDKVRNVVWVTADVHYAAAHHYAPERAQFTRFDPFWEFVAGPMHAGTFGPNALDATFGPEVRYQKPAPKPNRPPSDNLQFFGQLDVDAKTRALTVGLYDVTGARLFEVTLPPEGA